MRDKTALVPSSNKKGLTGLMVSAIIFSKYLLGLRGSHS